jgi:hypothetical protein
MASTSSSTTTSLTTPCATKDFLTQDAPIRGQNYACVSFVGPEDALQARDAYMFDRWVDFAFGERLQDMFDMLITRYPKDEDVIKSLKETHAAVIRVPGSPETPSKAFRSFAATPEGMAHARAYEERNEFRTSVRGLKVRGSYDTLAEAQARAAALKAQDNGLYDIYVCQVGCWCPWCPPPEELAAEKAANGVSDDSSPEEYGETALNTLMKEFRAQQIKKDAWFAQRLQSTAAAASAESGAGPSSSNVLDAVE